MLYKGYVNNELFITSNFEQKVRFAIRDEVINNFADSAHYTTTYPSGRVESRNYRRSTNTFYEF